MIYILFQEVWLSTYLKMTKDGLRRNKGIVTFGHRSVHKIPIKKIGQSLYEK